MIKIGDAPDSHALVVLEGIRSRYSTVLDREERRAVVTCGLRRNIGENQKPGPVAEIPWNDAIADGGIRREGASEHGGYGGIGFRLGDSES
jgi:hypothetical protein